MLPIFFSFFSNIFCGSVSKTYDRAQELEQLIPKPLQEACMKARYLGYGEQVQQFLISFTLVNP